MNEPSTQELAGRVAVVTGSSSGIGKATAIELAKAGADVVIHAGRNRKGADETVASVQALGRQAMVVMADLEVPQQMESLAETAWNWRGGVDIWINNAGADILTGASAKLSYEEKLKRLWQIDVLATVQLSRLVGARMQKRGSGSIINIGWDKTETGMAGDSGELFAASKGAVTAFTRSLAKSLAPQVRVNCVAPGWIKTAWGEKASDAWQQRAVSESLLERWGTPEDVARMIRFLASPAAEFVTGQVVAVNGGGAG